MDETGVSPEKNQANSERVAARDKIGMDIFAKVNPTHDDVTALCKLWQAAEDDYRDCRAAALFAQARKRLDQS